MSSAPVRYSIGGTSTSSPETSEKAPLTARPSSLMPVTRTSKLYAAYGSERKTGGMTCSVNGFTGGWLAPPTHRRLRRLGIQRLLLDPEDHELRGLDRGDADQADQAPVVDVVLGHGRAVDLDEE